MRSDLEAFQTAVGGFQSLTIDSSTDDISAARENVQQAWDQLFSALKE